MKLKVSRRVERETAAEEDAVRKSSSLAQKKKKKSGKGNGVYVCYRSLFPSHTPSTVTASSSSLSNSNSSTDTSDSSTSSNHEDQPQHQESLSSPPVGAVSSPLPALAWQCAGTSQHNLGAPALVSNPDQYHHHEGNHEEYEQAEEEEEEGDAAASSRKNFLHRISGKNRHPKDTPPLPACTRHAPDTVAWIQEQLHFVWARAKRLPKPGAAGIQLCSNHLLVNQERTWKGLASLHRMRELDTLARMHAQQMADQQDVHHVDLEKLRQALQNKTCRRLGSNVADGMTMRDMHDDMMKSTAERNNILDPRMTHMGMGTARGKNGELYLCQVFRG